MSAYEIWQIVLAILSIGIATTSIIIALIQSAKKNSVQKAKFLGELVNSMNEDQDIYYVMYLIDYGYLWWQCGFVDGQVIENKVDKTFAFYSYVCQLKYKHLIDEDGFSFFKYDIKRALENDNTKRYFKFLRGFANNNNAPFPFEALLQYGKELKIYI